MFHSLNVVCGPNGTGKSTILCAICLGLGGQPPLLGRADDARTFIMHTESQAMIEIELAPHNPSHPNPTVHVIKRLIDRNKGSERGRGKAASTYWINDDVVNLKAVQELVAGTYKIAIDNLCTFLPQDRVGSFSGFDSKMLLAETEKSVSASQHLYTAHQELIALEQQIVSSGSNLQTLQENVTRFTAQTAEYAAQKELMEERQECVKEQALVNQKRAWVKFDLAREEALELKMQKKAVGERVKQVHEGLKPVEEALGQVQHEINASQQETAGYQRAISTCMRQYETGETKANTYLDKMDETQVELNLLDSSKRRAEENVVKCRQALEATEEMLKGWAFSLEELEQKEEESKAQVRAGRMETNQRKRELSRLVNEQRDRQGALKQLESKFEHMQDEKGTWH